MLVHGHAWQGQQEGFEELNEVCGSGSQLERGVTAAVLPMAASAGVIFIAAQRHSLRTPVLAMACISHNFCAATAAGSAGQQLEGSVVEQWQCSSN